MKIADLHACGINHPRIALLVFLSLSLLFVWGNVRVQKGGILDEHVILREDDPVRQMDQYVQEKVQEGFEGRAFISFILHSGARSTEDLGKVLTFTAAAKETFGEAIISLAEVPAYQDTGDTLRDEPYVTAGEITHPSFDLHAWHEKVATDPSVYGLLVGRDFSWTAVIRYLSPEADEISEFRKTVEFLEDRKIPWWEWFWKRDIAPHDPSVGVGGWAMGRGLIDQGLNVDMLTLVSLGVVLTLPLFWAVLGSARLALLGIGVMIVGGFVWTRGAMGLLGVHERVFSLLAYANVIVQGTSFALHKLAALRESDAQEHVVAWQKARSVDTLLATTAGVAVFGFATLWTFGLKPIRELGLVSALGVVWLLVLAVFFLPALHALMFRQKRGARHTVPLQSHRRVDHVFDMALERLVSSCQHATAWLAEGKRSWGVVGVVCGLFVLVAFLFAQGRIVSRTRPLEFMRGTLVGREAAFLNQPGNVGFDFLDLLVEPTGGGRIYDPHFLARAWELQAAFKGVSEARETTSILSTLQQIARESFKKELPATQEEVETAFFLIENRLAPAVQRQLYFPEGIRIAVSSSTEESVEQGRFYKNILTLAHRDFPDLKVSTFNKNSLSPQVDQYVRQGKMSNAFVSQLGIALLCGVLIFWRNRRLGAVRLSPLRGGLLMSLPLFFATTVMGLLMWALEIALDMSTACITALAINAATDFSLYLVMTYQAVLQALPPKEALQVALRQEGKIIVADCLLNTLCFLPLITSHFLPVRQLGWMMGVMLVACAAGTLIIMAALLPACVVRKERIA